MRIMARVYTAAPRYGNDGDRGVLLFCVPRFDGGEVVVLPEERKERGTALITGASSGIGADLARLFAREGHDLVLVARDEARLRALGDDVARRDGIRAEVMAVDLADPGAPREIIRRLGEREIVLDVLVNNAGFGTYGPFAATDLGRQLQMLQVNVVALTHLTGLVLPAMLSRRRGRILNVASTAAFQPGPFMAVYYATKAYVLHFTEALAAELGEGTGVSVTALCPGPTRTGFQAAAGIEGTRLLRSALVMESEAVARAGYRGLMEGKPVVIPGVKNRMVAWAVRLLPRAAVTRLVRRAHAHAAGAPASGSG